MQSTSVSTRFDAETLARLDEIAQGRGKTRTDIIKEAVTNFLDYDFWFQEKVAQGLKDLDEGDIVSHDEVKNSIRAMGFHVD